MSTVICPSCKGIRGRTDCESCGGTGVVYEPAPNPAPGAAVDPAKSVAAFATELRKPVERLLEQLHAAGCGSLSAQDEMSNEHKVQLLKYLRTSHK